MKKHLVLVLGLIGLVNANAFAAYVKSAKLDAQKKNILVDVSYGGGCGDHEFSLQVGECLETFPAQCSAKLIEKTNDNCEALISATVTISLEQYGLTDSYYQRASLTIMGDKNEQTNNPTSATVRLP